jgi:dTDP-4-amino-4,6-dideoxygalactose transaminase
MKERYVHTTFGLNLRMTEIAAAMGSTSLARLVAGNAKRAEHAAFYATELQGIDGLVLPVDHSGGGHVWHQYTVRVLGGRRDTVLARLREAGVGADVYYPTCVHAQPAYASGISLPVAEALATEVISIPVFPGLTDGERAQVAKALADAVREA